MPRIPKKHPAWFKDLFEYLSTIDDRNAWQHQNVAKTISEHWAEFVAAHPAPPPKARKSKQDTESKKRQKTTDLAEDEHVSVSEDLEDESVQNILSDQHESPQKLETKEKDRLYVSLKDAASSHLSLIRELHLEENNPLVESVEGLYEIIQKLLQAQ